MLMEIANGGNEGAPRDGWPRRRENRLAAI